MAFTTGTTIGELVSGYILRVPGCHVLEDILESSLLLFGITRFLLLDEMKIFAISYVTC